MPDRRQTFTPILEGGILENLSPIDHGQIAPGSLRAGQNFEPGDRGGYRRIKGFDKYDPDEVPGSGKILGVFPFKDTVVACRGTGVYTSSGSGWTLIHTQPMPPNEYIGTRYRWSADTLVLVDGVNRAIKWDGTTLTVLPIETEGAVAVAEHKRHLWVVKDSILTSSAPNDDTIFNGTSGSIVINMGATKNGLASWRNTLYVFGTNTIDRIDGDVSDPSSPNLFSLQPVTDAIGAVSGRGIIEFSSDLYYVSSDGIRTISGTDRVGDVEVAVVSRQIERIFDRLEVNDPSRDISAIVIPSLSQMRFFSGDSTRSNRSGRGLLGGLRINSSGQLGLEWFRLLGFNAACSGYDSFNNKELIVFGGYDGFVYEIGQGNSLDGDPIHSSISFPYWSLGDNLLRKTLYKGTLFINTLDDVSPRLSYNYDLDRQVEVNPPAIPFNIQGEVPYGDAFYGVSNYGGGSPVIELGLVGSGDNVSLSISSNDTKGQYTLQQISIEYSQYGRR